MSSALPPLGRLTSVKPMDLWEPPALQAQSQGVDSRNTVNFQETLMQSLEQLQQQDNATQSAIEQGLMTGDLNQAEIFMAMKKTDMAYRTAMQIRNKLLDAYNEIQQMRM